MTNILNSAGSVYAPQNHSVGYRQATPMPHPPLMRSNIIGGVLLPQGVQDGILDRVESYEKTGSGILIPTIRDVDLIAIQRIEVLRPETNNGLILV